MGVVYRARDPRLGRTVAIKVLAQATHATETQRARFAAEAAALARFQDPGVVRVHAAGEERGTPYLVMDFVEGESLEARLLRGPLEQNVACGLIASLARSLSAAHAAGILHRDLKPDNVLLRAEDDRPVLIDFGLAKDLREGVAGPTRTGTILGTPGFWSPEQAEGKREAVGPRTDVYGLGTLLYAALTTRAPFVGANLAEVVIATVHRPPEAPSQLRAGVDPALERICLRCLAKRPEDRYASPLELAEALEAWERGERGGRRRPWQIGALGGLLTLILVGIALAPRGAEPHASPSASAPPVESPRATPTQTPEVPTRARWEPLPERIRGVASARTMVLPGGAQQELRRLCEDVPALVHLGRLESRLRVGEGPSARLYELGLAWRRHPTRTALAPLAFYVGAVRADAACASELALSFVREEPLPVRDPGFGERYLIGMLARGYGHAGIGLGWAYEKRLPGLSREDQVRLRMAAFVLARRFGDEQAEAPLRALEGQETLPTAERAYRLLSERAAWLEAQPPAPIWRRGPPVELPPEERLELLRGTIGRFLVREETIRDLHERALVLPPLPKDEDDLPRRLRGVLRGDAKHLWTLGHELALAKDARLRRIGRVLLVRALQAGHSRGHGSLSRSFGIEQREEHSIACMLLSVQDPSKDDQLWRASMGARGKPPTRERAWELLWEGYEEDLRWLGLGELRPPLGLGLPPQTREIAPNADLAMHAALLTRLQDCAPALQALEREALDLELSRKKPAKLHAASKSLEAAGDGLGRGGVALITASAGGATNLNTLSEALTSRVSPVRDQTLAALLLYASASAGGSRAWAHLSRLHGRNGEDSLVIAAIVLSGRMGDPGGERRLRTMERNLPQRLPSPEEALALHREDLERRLREPFALPSAWSLRNTRLSEEAQRARVRRLCRMLTLRSAALDKSWQVVPAAPSDALLARAREFEERSPDVSGAILLRCGIDHGTPSVLGPLAGALRGEAFAKLRWALHYGALEVEGGHEPLVRLARAAYAAGSPRLAGAAARLASEGGAVQLESLLGALPGIPRLKLDEARALVLVDRERAYLAAGFPAVRFRPYR